jgi:hypothetical protein
MFFAQPVEDQGRLRAINPGSAAPAEELVAIALAMSQLNASLAPERDSSSRILAATAEEGAWKRQLRLRSTYLRESGTATK